MSHVQDLFLNYIGCDIRVYPIQVLHLPIDIIGISRSIRLGHTLVIACRGNNSLKSALLGKISFWLIVVGSAALLTPQPAWPEWLARMILSAGIALGATTLGVLLWQKHGRSSKK
ncbi:MAG: hypothetical protein ABW118_00800 [Candidatus Thiodiazotropha sp.]